MCFVPKSITDLDDPYTKADLKQPLRTVRTRNMETVPYESYAVRDNIDSEAFADFTLSAILNTVETEFEINTTAF